jgi:hypothetical protein
MLGQLFQRVAESRSLVDSHLATAAAALAKGDVDTAGTYTGYASDIRGDLAVREDGTAMIASIVLVLLVGAIALQISATYRARSTGSGGSESSAVRPSRGLSLLCAFGTLPLGFLTLIQVEYLSRINPFLLVLPLLSLVAIAALLVIAFQAWRGALATSMPAGLRWGAVAYCAVSSLGSALVLL